MKRILFLCGVATLLATAGCLVEDGPPGHYREHGRYEGRSEVIEAPPVVIVHPPEMIVRPPEIIVR